MRIYIVPVIVMLIVLPGIQSAIAQGFNVHGEVNGLESPALLLMMHKQDSLEIEKIYTESGRFSFKGEVDEPYFLQIMKLEGVDGFNTTGKLTEFIIENSEIRILGTSPDYEDVTVHGSQSDMILKEYLASDQELADTWYNLKARYDQAVEADDAELVEELKYSLNGLTSERVTLLKSYVSRYSSSIIGALLPNFCSLENVLTSDDYFEMYESLSNEIQKTGYGKSILNHSNR